MRIKTNIIITVGIIIFALLRASLVNAEPMRLQSANERFPVALAFPIPPRAGQMPNPALPNSMVYYFTAQDTDASLAYAATVVNIPEDLGLIPKDTAIMMINQSLDTQIASFDAAVGVKGKIIGNSTAPFSGYQSKYLEVVRQTTPKLCGIYRAVIVDRLLITVWASGLDTSDNRLQAKKFVQSLKFAQ